METVDMVIEEQGAPIVNDAYKVFEGKDFVLVAVDLTSKWCEVSCTCGTSLYISATEIRSCHLKPDTPFDAETVISFPAFNENDWCLWSTQLSRYTLKIVFERINKEE